MKEIKLTQGKFAQVDEEDFEYINQFKWYVFKKGNTFYASRNSDRINGIQKTIYMSREILGLTNCKILVDHKDMNGLNNQRSNLRMATCSQNSANRTSRKKSTSKYLGVCLIKDKVKGKVYVYWLAQIAKEYKVMKLGRFKNEIDAALAYNKKAIELHGEFANLNII